jgi:hypothetical protein
MAGIESRICAALGNVTHLAPSDPQRVAIGELTDNIRQAADALSGLDIGERRTSKRRIDDINSALSALEIFAGRVELLSMTIEDETEEAETTYDPIDDILEPGRD